MKASHQFFSVQSPLLNGTNGIPVFPIMQPQKFVIASKVTAAKGQQP